MITSTQLNIVTTCLKKAKNQRALKYHIAEMMDLTPAELEALYTKVCVYWSSLNADVKISMPSDVETSIWQFTAKFCKSWVTGAPWKPPITTQVTVVLLSEKLIRQELSFMCAEESRCTPSQLTEALKQTTNFLDSQLSARLGN